MFTVKCDETSGHKIRCLFMDYLYDSRFTISEIFWKNNKIHIKDVRLKESKSYCGNHPGPCKGLVEKKNRKISFLEGADWVAFDALLNDVLDALCIDGDAGNRQVNIRLGRQRRISYDLGSHGDDWQKFGSYQDYADWCGQQAPPTEYPSGTPGNSSWRINKQAEVQCG